VSLNTEQLLAEAGGFVNLSARDDGMFSIFRGRIVWGILAAALCLRLGAALVANQHVQHAGREFLVEGDANGYWELGRRLAAGESYELYEPPRRVLRTPGFPLLLAAFRPLTGNSIPAATLAMALIGTAGCLLTGLLGACCAGRRCGLATLTIAAVSPLQVGMSIQILSEVWFGVWLVLAVLVGAALVRPAVLRPCSVGGWSLFVRGLVSGLVAGAGVLVRPGWILWPAVFAMWLLIQSRRGRVLLPICAGLFLGCWLILLPWAWRNHSVTGKWIYTSLWSGPSLYDGLNPAADGSSDMQFFERDGLSARMDEIAVDRFYRDAAFEFAAANPRRTFELAVIKGTRFLSLTLNAAEFSAPLVDWTCLGWYGVLLMLAVAGISTFAQRRSLLLLLVAPFFLFFLVHLAFVGSVRYRLPAELPLYVISGAGFLRLVDGRKVVQRRHSEAVLTVSDSSDRGRRTVV
jgi:hypothetical protein